MKIYIGHDPREPEASRVAAKTLHEVTNGELVPEFLDVAKLQAQGLLTRPVDHRTGVDYDLVSNAPASTRFAVSRFLVPILCQQGYALFTDADVVFREDPRNMLGEIDPDVAVSVVRRGRVRCDELKMVDQVQTTYPRKGWSSVALWNCCHPANQRLSLRDVNERPGRDLHGFYFLHDTEIGVLHPRWNVLVNVDPIPKALGVLHFTLGGPFIKGWGGAPNDDLWNGHAN